MKLMKLLPAILLTLILAGCQSAYYGAMEELGYAKRDILIDRVEDAAVTQDEIKTEFNSAYQAFNQLLNLTSTPLEARYETLNDAYEDSLSKAEELYDRVDAVESVADALFNEWQDELSEYSDAKLRASSARQLQLAKSRYQTYLRSLHQSRDKVEPVLAVFKDQVLFLKHNLNAEKISALKGEVQRFDSDVQGLVQAMDQSIAQAKTFVKDLQ